MSAIERGDRVITPMDEVARVLEVDREAGELELEYLHALTRANAGVTMRVSHCAVWREDAPRPRPVRRR